MVRDAEANAEEDKKPEGTGRARNQGDALVHSTKKALANTATSWKPARRKIEAAIKNLEEALKGDDKATIDAKTEALSTAAQKLGEKMYADQQAQAAAAGGAAGAAGAQAGAAGAAPKDDNVVDADFKEVIRD
jgi:molecular chaperone DnaK